MRSSRLGGVPSAPAGSGHRPPGAARTGPRRRRGTAGGAARDPSVARRHPRRGWLAPAEQRALVEQFRRWALPPAGLRHPRVPTGHLMTVQSVCLGWHWQPYTYSRTADDTDGPPVKPMPTALVALARQAVEASHEPDAAIVNYYAPGAHLGLHQDGEEPSGTGRHDQPRRHLRLPDRGRRSTDRPVHRYRAPLRRPARVWWSESAHLSRRAEGARRDRSGVARSPTRPRQHHRPRNRTGMTGAHPFEQVVAEHGPRSSGPVRRSSVRAMPTTYGSTPSSRPCAPTHSFRPAATYAAGWSRSPVTDRSITSAPLGVVPHRPTRFPSVPARTVTRWPMSPTTTPSCASRSTPSDPSNAPRSSTDISPICPTPRSPG